jgi:hypothetical protein
MQRARKVVPVALLCLLIGGCGGGDKAANSSFKTEYLKATAPIKQLGADIARAIERSSKRSDATVKAEFNSFADRFDAQLIELESLQAPPSVAGAFSKMTLAASRLEDDLRSIASGAGSRDPVEARTGLRSLLQDADAMNAAGGTINQTLGIK